MEPATADNVIQAIQTALRYRDGGGSGSVNPTRRALAFCTLPRARTQGIGVDSEARVAMAHLAGGSGRVSARTPAHTLPCTHARTCIACSSWGVIVEVVRTAGLEDAVGFFAANMLETKIHREWSTLSPHQRAWVLEGMGAHWASLSTTPPTVLPSATARRAFVSKFCSAMVAAASQEGDVALAGCLSSALTVGSAAVAMAWRAATASDADTAHTMTAQLVVALSLLRSYGMDVCGRPGKYRAAALAAARARLDDLTALLEAAAVTSETLAAFAAAAAAAPDRMLGAEPVPVSVMGQVVLTALSWLSIATATAFIPAGLTLGKLQATRPGMLAAALVGMGAAEGDSAEGEACKELLVQLMGHAATELETTVQAAALSPASTAPAAAAAAAIAETAISPTFTRRHTRSVGEGGAGVSLTGAGGGRDAVTVDTIAVLTADEAHWTLLGFRTVMNGLAALQPKLAAACNSGDTEFALLVVTATTTLVSSVPQLVVTCGGAAEPVRTILLQCAQQEHLSVQEIADEAWPFISDVPAPSRDPLFQAPLFVEVLQCLLRGCALPADLPATGLWQDYSGDVDRDEFFRFRSSIVVPALRVCACVCCCGMLVCEGSWVNAPNRLVPPPWPSCAGLLRGARLPVCALLERPG